MSDFRDRFGVELSAAAASLAGAPEADFRARLGVQFAAAAAELAAGYEALAPAAAASTLRGRARRRRPRLLAPGLARVDFRGRFGVTLSRSAAELAGRGVPGERSRRRRVPWLTRPVAVGLAVTAFAGTAFAAVAIWTPLLGNPQYGYNPGAASSPPPADQLAALAVLRRPQSAADRGALSAAALTYINDYTKGVRTAYVRLLATVGTEAFVLVPVEERRATSATGGVATPSSALKDALCVYVSDASPAAEFVECWSLAQVEAADAAATFNGQLFGLAPDGVSSVRVDSQGSPSLSSPANGNFFSIALGAGVPPPVGSAVTFTRSGA